MINIRVTDTSDMPAIQDGLNNKIWQRSNKIWTRFANEEAITNVLLNQEEHIHSVIVEETYLIVFSHFRPWFSSEFFIEEKLVWRAYPNGKAEFSAVIEALKHMVRVTNSAGILSGTLMAENDEALIRMYKRHGFEQIQIGLFKIMKE